MSAAERRRIFVLDTNVLMHDPTALFRFKEHDVYLPMVVLEELDGAKKGVSEVARNVRQASRFLDALMSHASKEAIEQGIPLAPVGTPNGHDTAPDGRLFLQTRDLPFALPEGLPGNRPDNTILSTALAVQQVFPDLHVALVTKDINLRIKAAALGVHAEDYYNDQVLEDADLLYTGMSTAPTALWDDAEPEGASESGRSRYCVPAPAEGGWHPNHCLASNEGDGRDALVRGVNAATALIEPVVDYRAPPHTVWGITARNPEQNFALNLLMDPEIDFVSLVGPAGTGKTLLTLAAGLVQTLEENRYREIIMTRVTVPVGEDIGFLPGTEEEKMTPWMGALVDNLEVLTKTDAGGSWGRAATNDLLHNRIKIHSLNFMRGRTFLNKYLILDEAQNLTSKQMKTLITRAGPGTKVICLGNIAQIDTPYLTETTSGLTYVVDRFKDWPHSGHITLRRGERSRLADYASDAL